MIWVDKSGNGRNMSLVVPAIPGTIRFFTSDGSNARVLVMHPPRERDCPGFFSGILLDDHRDYEAGRYAEDWLTDSWSLAPVDDDTWLFDRVSGRTRRRR